MSSNASTTSKTPTQGARLSALETQQAADRALLAAIAAKLGVGEPVKGKATPAKVASKPKGRKTLTVTCVECGAKVKTVAVNRKRCDACAEAKRESFQAVIEGRAARKNANHEASAWLRGHKIPVTQEVWDAVKSGERDLRKLRSLAGVEEPVKAKKASKKAESNVPADVEAKDAEIAAEDAKRAAKVAVLVEGGYDEHEAEEIVRKFASLNA